MKRKDLEDLGLEKEVVDKIMGWNGADIEAEKAKIKAAEGERDNYKSQLDTATEELDKFKDFEAGRNASHDHKAPAGSEG